MKILICLSLGLATIFMLSCDKTKDCPECFTPPQELNLKITDYTTGSDLIFSDAISPDSIEFFYYENEQKIILEHETFIDSANSRTILVCYEISWKSPQGIKDFYLYLGNNDMDTIFLDVEKRNTDCCTYHEWIDFKINENQVVVDSSDYIYNHKKPAANNAL